MSRIYLSPPHMCGEELALLSEAFASNWIAPLGPWVDAFENAVAARVRLPHACALATGTAGLHLALAILGVGPGDTVLTSTLTFSATANAITYVGAQPVFVDSVATSWNIDPALVEQELADRAAAGTLPKAVVAVDLYGQCADYDPLLSACERYGVPLVEDAAEALGASYKGKPAGGFGAMGVFSFNGNKIITTSGGGMLVSSNASFVERARFLATQARDSAPHYEHSTVGYNYRLSNLLAAVGVGQLRVLDQRVEARRANFAFYKEALGGLPGIEFMPEAPYGRSTRWLTCLTIDPAEFGATREDVRVALGHMDIEARPVWKPMHLQPVFRALRAIRGNVAADLFDRGLCLPSGSALTQSDLHRIADAVRSVHTRGRSSHQT